jgi:Short C-terminal domain
VIAILAAAALSAVITIAANAADWPRITLYVILGIALVPFLAVALPIIAPPDRREPGRNEVLDAAKEVVDAAGAVDTAAEGGGAAEAREAEAAPEVEAAPDVEAAPAEAADEAPTALEVEHAAETAPNEALGILTGELPTDAAEAQLKEGWGELLLEPYEYGYAERLPLTERERELLVLLRHYGGDKSAREVAEHLQISPATVATLGLKALLNRVAMTHYDWEGPGRCEAIADTLNAEGAPTLSGAHQWSPSEVQTALSAWHSLSDFGDDDRAKREARAQLRTARRRAKTAARGRDVRARLLSGAPGPEQSEGPISGEPRGRRAPKGGPPGPPRENPSSEHDEPEPAYAPAPAAAAPPAEDPIEQLKQLAQLRDQGILTDEEFAAQKAKILG